MNLMQKLYGYFWIFMSVMFFFFMTVIVKIITKSKIYQIEIMSRKFDFVVTGNIHSLEVALFRFLTGFVFIITMLFITKKKINPINKKALWARGIFNTLAVIMFFVTIQLSNITKGNIYNMTYPVFVACFAPIFLKEKMTLIKFMFVGLAFAGTYLISGINLSESFASVGVGDFTGVLSGIIAGLAIIALKQARKTEDSFTILFYLLSIGLGISILSNLFIFKVPNLFELLLLLLVGVLSFMGQFSITFGYKYVTAVEGSIISSSRIFVATLFGFLFLNEILSGKLLLGALFIAISIIAISIIDSKSNTKKN